MTNTTASITNQGRLQRAIAFGAGITATLTAGIVFSAIGADAAFEPDESTFVPITPCRLFDTRPGSDNVGDRSTPLGMAETMTVQVTGANGDCTIPSDASAVAFNATAVGASAGSFATFYPSGATRPLSSNLNYEPGQPATPNKVDVKLSGDGKVDIYNHAGSVNLLADVMGYYRDSGLSDLEASMSVAYQAVSKFDSTLTLNEAVLLSLTGNAPAAGSLVVDYAAKVHIGDAGKDVECGLSEGDAVDDRFEQQFESAGPDGSVGNLAGSRIFDVDPGAFAINVVCNSNGNGRVDDLVMTGIFIAD